MDHQTEAWIAFDADHFPPRAWRMVGATPQSAALEVRDLAAAVALAPEDDLLTFAEDATAALPVPAKPTDLPVTMSEDQAHRIYRLGAMQQSRPFGRLQGAAGRISGFLSLNKDWDGVICLPGRHYTHWVQISAEEVVSFISFATLPLVSTFCPTDCPTGGSPSSVDEAALVAALQDVLSRPETLALRLAEARSMTQAGATSDAAARGQIWGAALGAELAASRPYWLGQNLALIAPAALAAPYRAALLSQHMPVTETDEARMTLAGFLQARSRCR
ncbi:2-dehydro-3-deoxygalactonokinase [Phaeobacter sp. B1627]|nr:2-dehydro-3-deoxygalactonokinase [Phaeobacter sp. B1627]